MIATLSDHRNCRMNLYIETIINIDVCLLLVQLVPVCLLCAPDFFFGGQTPALNASKTS